MPEWLMGGTLAMQGAKKVSKLSSGLVVLAERELTRACLWHWLRAILPEFDTTVAAGLNNIYSEESRNAPEIVLIYASSCDQIIGWVKEKIAETSECYQEARIILIVDGLDPDLVQNLLGRWAVDAIIPTTDTTEIAAAALRLVLAGGQYFPKAVTDPALSEGGIVPPVHNDRAAILGTDLTAREHAVLELLKTGNPNKIIAQKLGISVSTTKIHMHNIIRKLKVKNRTEAVIAAGKLSITQSQFVKAATTKGCMDLQSTVNLPAATKSPIDSDARHPPVEIEASQAFRRQPAGMVGGLKAGSFSSRSRRLAGRNDVGSARLS
jgi:DNA-binding NarL/FixJ family response regulator